MRMKKNGYSLVLTITMSVIVMAVLFGIYRVVAALYTSTSEGYYIKLAEEAGESGTAYANNCLGKYGNTQTWGDIGSGKELTTASDCRGKQNVYTNNKYVLINSKVRTSFKVGKLEGHADQAAQISAIGEAEVLNSSGVVIRTYSVVVKKSIVWPTNLVAQKSVSGTRRTCGILSGDVYCWGNNVCGQLGNGRSGNCRQATIESGSSVDSVVPVKVLKQIGVLLGKNITDIFTAQYHTCVIADGEVYCWGYNGNGQLGNGRSGVNEFSNVPVKIGGLLAGKTVTTIGGSQNASCAIAGGKIYCWGDYRFRGESNSWPKLVEAGTHPDGLPGNYIATGLSTSGSRSANMCAIAGGYAYCWGQNHAGQVGNGGVTSHTQVVNYPSIVKGLSNVTAISQDGYPYHTTLMGRQTHICAIASGKVYCWGGGSNGQLGYHVSDYSTMPQLTRMSSGREFFASHVEAGINHTCALNSKDSKVYCWGSNVYGQLGNGTNINHTHVPTPVVVGNNGIPYGQTVVNVAGGANRGCAVVSNGRSYCWGWNNAGQIGDNTRIDRFTPTESLFLRPVENRYIY